MPYGLRFHTISQSIGTSCSFYLPPEDMPSEDSERGSDLYEDIIETPTGNTFIYSFAKKKAMSFIFEDISTRSKELLEHCSHGWIGSKQITVLVFGSSVIGTAESMASMSTAGQVMGTGYFRLTGKPRERALDLWSFSAEWKEFGPNQSFT